MEERKLKLDVSATLSFACPLYIISGLSGKVEVSSVVYKVGESMQELIKLWKEYESSQSQMEKNGESSNNGPTLEIRIPSEHITATNRQVSLFLFVIIIKLKNLCDFIFFGRGEGNRDCVCGFLFLFTLTICLPVYSMLIKFYVFCCFFCFLK